MTETIGAAITTYRRDSSGACVQDSAAFTGTLFVLDPVPTPPDAVGPLTLV